MALFAKLRESLRGVREKWSAGISKLFSSGKFDADFWDSLEEQLISGDTGLDFTEEMIDYLKAESKRRGISSPEGLKDIFTAKIVDELSSDYDVDRLMERMKEKIYEDGAYRNVNTISFIK